MQSVKAQPPAYSMWARLAQWLDLTRVRIDRATADLEGLTILTRTHAPLLMGRIVHVPAKRGRFGFYSLWMTGRYDCPQVHISFALNRCSAMSTSRTATKPITC